MIDQAALTRWRADPISFIETVLIDPESGGAFVLLPAERDFLTHAFRVGDDGRLLSPELIYSAPKKSGKTTMAALVVITVVLLYGGAYPEAIVAANSFEQTTARVFAVVRRIIENSPLLRREAKLTEAKITLAGATITAIPSDYASAAGSNQNIAVFDELWAFDSERSRRLFDELVAVPTRKIACRLTTTYAGFTGESVLLEELYRRGMAQPEIAPNLRGGDGILMAWHHQPVAPWQSPDWPDQMRRSLRPNQYLRLIENRFVTTEGDFVPLSAWDACVDPNIGHAVNNPLLPIYVGIDASVKHDSTAVVAVSFDKAAQQVRLITHRVFQPAPDAPLNFEQTIEATVRELAKRFSLRQCLFDPYQMQATSQRLIGAGIPMQEFAQSSPNLTAASQNLYDLILGGSLRCYPDASMRLALTRCIAIKSPRGWRIVKEKTSHKIDVIVALAMASYAAVQGANDPAHSFDSSYAAWDPNFLTATPILTPPPTLLVSNGPQGCTPTSPASTMANPMNNQTHLGGDIYLCAAVLARIRKAAP